MRINGIELNPIIKDFSLKYEEINDKFVISYIGAIDGWKRTHLFIKSLSFISKK